MNQNDDTQRTPPVDSLVADEYRALASEAAPARLDDLVLAEARSASRAHRAAAWPATWFRPFAIVATISVSLAIVLQLSDSFVSPAPEQSASPDLPEPAAAQPATRMPVQAGGIAETGEQRQVADSVAGARLQASQAPGFTDEDAATHTETQHCDSSETTSVAGWSICIERLRLEGRASDAEFEHELLLRTYPHAADPD